MRSAFTACPVTTAKAPLDAVWRLLSEPENFSIWWEAHTRRVDPPGPAQPGQMVYATAGAFVPIGKITVRVDAIDPARHQLHLTTRLPLGITVYNHITCTEVDPETTFISFG